MIRIISGTFRGRRIQAPKKLPVRPTTDRAKEGLFNILSNRINYSETSALDLFAGTVNLSYELASRGCKSILAVDRDRYCTQFITEVSEKIGAGSIKVLRSSVDDLLDRTDRTFDLILADPPYDYTAYADLVETIFERQILNPGGLLVIEHDSKITLEDMSCFSESRRYGNSSFSFFSLTK